MDDALPRGLHNAAAPPADVIAGAAAPGRGRRSFYPTISVELMPQTDEGEVNVNAELAVGTRIERVHDGARAARGG